MMRTGISYVSGNGGCYTPERYFSDYLVPHGL